MLLPSRTLIDRAGPLARTATASERADAPLPGRAPAACLQLALRGLAVDERAAARYVALRTALWRALLGHLPAVEPICALARETLARELCPAPTLARLHAAARALRERDGMVARTTFEAAREAAAAQLGAADPDGLLRDRLVADLTELELQRDGAVVPIRVSPGVLRFSHYVTAVRLNYDALHGAQAAALAGAGPLDVLVRALAPAPGPLADLIVAAEDGLRRALGRFDPRCGLPLSVRAAWWLRRALALVTGRLPHDPDTAARAGRRLVQEFTLVHGRSPCEDELALLRDPADVRTRTAGRLA